VVGAGRGFIVGDHDRYVITAAHCLPHHPEPHLARGAEEMTYTDLIGRRAWGMIGKEYLVRQAMTLLRLAKTVKDPQVQAGFATKAAELQERLEETPAAQRPDTDAESYRTS
jgi:hypothetical protein